MVTPEVERTHRKPQAQNVWAVWIPILQAEGDFIKKVTMTIRPFPEISESRSERSLLCLSKIRAIPTMWQSPTYSRFQSQAKRPYLPNPLPLA